MNAADKSTSYMEVDADAHARPRHPLPRDGIGCFGERLKEALASTSVRSFARSCGLSEGAIRSYLSDETYPTLDRLEMIAKASGRSAKWLAFGIEPAPEALEEEVYAYIPLYDTEVSAGHGTWSENAQVLTRLAFTRYSLRARGLSPDDLSAVRIAGDSNEPELSDGDTVVIDHSSTSVRKEGYYVILLDGHLYAKRLQRQLDGGMAVISANPAYQTLLVPKASIADLVVIGSVVWIGRWLV